MSFFIVMFLLLAVVGFVFEISKPQKTLLEKAYKKKLNLSKYEIKKLGRHEIILNHQLLDFCREEAIKTYLHVIRDFNASQKRDLVLDKNIIKYSIYKIRESYKFKIPGNIQAEKLKSAVDPQIQHKIDQYITTYLKDLTENDERKLLAHDPERWKYKYSPFTENYDKSSPYIFYNNVCQLASLCSHITSQRDMFYKSHLFMAEKHKEISLKFYLHYLSIKSISSTFKHREINQKNTNRLFSTAEEQKEFSKICKQAKQKKIEAALEEVEILCQPKRKRIKLNVESIKDAGTKHKKVAVLLDEYLSDERPEIKKPEISAKELMQTTLDSSTEQLLHLFVSNAFRLNHDKVSTFAHERGLFKDTFIESINDTYYDRLDDLLIEDDNQHYTLNKDYYQQITE